MQAERLTPQVVRHVDNVVFAVLAQASRQVASSPEHFIGAA